MKMKWILKGIIFGVVFVVIGGLALMFLWNWLMPAIFGLKVISFLQALGLFVLSKILFGGTFRRGHGFGGRQFFWKNKMDEHFGGLTHEEQREKMRNFFRGNFEKKQSAND